MTKQKPIEMFMPPNMLKAKVGGTTVGLDMAAVKRGDVALTALKIEFSDWLTADIKALADRRAAFAENPSRETQADLFRASHDLRGQARTFEFPLVERVATSLCKLLEVSVATSALPLVEAHAGAIHVIVRDNIRNDSNPMALTLVRELESRVREFLSEAESMA